MHSKKLTILSIGLSSANAIIPLLLDQVQKEEWTKFGLAFITNHFIYFKSILIIVFCVSIIAVGLLNLSLYRLTDEKDDLEQYIEALGLNLKIKPILQRMAKDLDLDKKNHRITAYYYSAKVNQMFSLGRYSRSPEYDKNGRLIIKDSSEYVFKVLNQEEEEHIQNAPTKMNWRRRMKSRSIYGVGLTNKNDTLIGVIIFQHMQKDFFHLEEIRSKIASCVRKNNDKILSIINHQDFIFNPQLNAENERDFDKLLEKNENG